MYVVRVHNTTLSSEWQRYNRQGTRISYTFGWQRYFRPSKEGQRWQIVRENMFNICIVVHGRSLHAAKRRTQVERQAFAMQCNGVSRRT